MYILKDMTNKNIYNKRRDWVKDPITNTDTFIDAIHLFELSLSYRIREGLHSPNDKHVLYLWHKFKYEVDDTILVSDFSDSLSSLIISQMLLQRFDYYSDATDILDNILMTNKLGSDISNVIYKINDMLSNTNTTEHLGCIATCYNKNKVKCDAVYLFLDDLCPDVELSRDAYILNAMNKVFNNE